MVTASRFYSPNIGHRCVTETVIDLKDVHLRLGSGAVAVDVLKGISLSVKAGETAGIVGPSGSGKSTLLMVIAGLERADRGAVTIAGQNLIGLSEDRIAAFRGRTIGIGSQHRQQDIASRRAG